MKIQTVFSQTIARYCMNFPLDLMSSSRMIDKTKGSSSLSVQMKFSCSTKSVTSVPVGANSQCLNKKNKPLSLKYSRYHAMSFSAFSTSLVVSPSSAPPFLIEAPGSPQKVKMDISNFQRIQSTEENLTSFNSKSGSSHEHGCFQVH